MAIVNQPEDEQNKQTDGGTPVAGTAGASASDGIGVSGAGSSGAASPVKQDAAAQNQSGYTDVGSYLDANQAGAGQMGQQVAGNLTNKYNDVKSGAAQSANDLINQVNQGYTAENSQLINQVAADPYAAAQDPNQVSAYQAQLNDTYTGPTEWADYGTQQGKVADAQQYGSLANTPGGYNVYAQELEGPTASQGVNQLDSLLLQGNQSAAGAIKSAADPYSGLNGYLDQQNAAATGAISTGQTQAQQASQDALNAFTGANGTLTNLNNSLTTKASGALSAAQDQQSAIQKAISGLYSQPVDATASSLNGYAGSTTPWVNTTNYNVGTLDPQTLSALGMTADQWSALQGAMQQAGTSQNFTGHNFGAGSGTSQIDLSQWLSQQDPSSAINAGTVASKQDYDEMGAINQLLGSKAPVNNAIDPTQAALAGTAPSSFNQFDYAGALSSAQQVASLEHQQAQDEANSLSTTADAQHNAEKQKGIANAIKAAIQNPGKALAIDPRDALQNLKNAAKLKVTTGNDPLPNKDELHKLGIKS